MNFEINRSEKEIVPARNKVSPYTDFARIMLIAFLLIICCSACIKTEAFMDDRQLIFVITRLRNANQQGYNYIEEGALTAEDSSFYPLSVGWNFPVGLLHADENDVQVNAVIDTSLISYYDRITGSISKSPALPPGAFQLSQSSVVIKAGASVSDDSIRMKIINVLGLDRNQKYIIPVRIKSATTDESQRTDTLRQTLFFKVPFN